MRMYSVLFLLIVLSLIQVKGQKVNRRVVNLSGQWQIAKTDGQTNKIMIGV